MTILILISVTLVIFAVWLYFVSYPLYTSATLSDDTGFEYEPTRARKIGNFIRYIQFLNRLFIKISSGKLRKIFSKTNFGFKGKFNSNGLKYIRYGKFTKEFFPSFNNWLKNNKEIISGVKNITISSHSVNSSREYIVGSLNLPVRGYVNNSAILKMSFLPIDKCDDSLPKFLVDRTSNELTIKIIREKGNQQVDIQVIGIGFDVIPLEKESQTGNYLFFCWGCYFPNSGIQNLYIKMKLGSDNEYILHSISHRIRVVQFDHMTNNQIRLFAGIIGFVGTVLGICVALKKIGII